MPLGCLRCNDARVCGGIRPARTVISCHDDCCGNPASCTRVCENKPAEFSRRIREVLGWEFGTLPRHTAGDSPDLPANIPEIYHFSGRTQPLRAPAVAVPLWLVVRRACDEVRWASRAALMKHMRLSSRSALVIDGIGRDKFIERFWAERTLQKLVPALAALRPDWVIVPNYSLFTNVPRWDNLYSMKRIAIIWTEFSRLGVPTALTLNARTDRDWERWTEFVVERSEVRGVAIELGTGGRYADRRKYILEQTARLGSAAGGRLRLFARGGRDHLDALRESFCGVHLLDTNPFMKAVHRQRLVQEDSGVATRRSWTLEGQPIEHLLQGNVTACAGMKTMPG